MTAGETWDSCLKEIEALPAVQKYQDDVKVSMYMYDRPSWTGEVYETECFFPTWINKESAAHVQALADAHKALWGEARIGHADADPKYDAMPLRGLRPRRGIAGPCAQRDHLETGSGDLRRPVRRRARPVQSGGKNRRRHGIPSVPDRQ